MGTDVACTAGYQYDLVQELTKRPPMALRQSELHHLRAQPDTVVVHALQSIRHVQGVAKTLRFPQKTDRARHTQSA